MGRLSTTPVEAEFYPPDNIERPNPLEDYEMGGVALSDPTGGLQDRIWTCRVDSAGRFSLSAPGVPETVIFSALGTTDMNFTFDQNMRPFFAYTQNGRAKIRWYDTVAGENVITELTPGDMYLRCCLDDRRASATAQGLSDIILAYVRGGKLYYRQQRDRFEVEYLLSETIPAKVLTRIGMAKNNRLQFEFV